MPNEEQNNSESKDVREPAVEYAFKRQAPELWKDNSRQLISLAQIEDVAQRIAEKFQVDKIILFGSYAYGTPGEGSDVDLLVVMQTDRRPLQHTLEIIRALSPLRFSIDIIVRSEKDILKRTSKGDWMLKDAYEKGKLLYAR